MISHTFRAGINLIVLTAAPCLVLDVLQPRTYACSCTGVKTGRGTAHVPNTNLMSDVNDLHVSFKDADADSIQVVTATLSSGTKIEGTRNATDRARWDFSFGFENAGVTASLEINTQRANAPAPVVAAIESHEWTLGGSVVEATPDPTRIDVITNPNGTATVRLTNLTTAPLAYSGLLIATGADGTFFPDDYLSGLSTGDPVSLLIPSSGTFMPGVTTVATFTPSDVIGVYDGGKVLIEGRLHGGAEALALVPEPSSWVLFLLGAVAAVGLFHRRRAAVVMHQS